MKDPTEITVTRDGLAWRGGKVLGRKPWVVQTETQVTISRTTEVKALTKEEAEEKAINMANSRAKRLDANAYTEVVGCYSEYE
jgi:hypothetical protein|tara:strand:- start:342 stop:590 length:249 start_codon:yes stop_codon:yes gene_type:complete